MQFQQATADQLAGMGPGFQGSWNNVDIYQSDSVSASGGNRRGAMFGQGCFAYTLAQVAGFQRHVPADHVWLSLPELLIEMDRSAANGMTTLYGNIYPSVVEAEDLRGVSITTDQ